MAVADLPFWTILPNWRQPVIERLEALTSVLGSPSGAEQRFGARWTPRRSFEALTTVSGLNRMLFDSAIGAVGGNPWWLPVWPDVQRLTIPVPSGNGSISCVTTNREFRAGGFAMLWRDEFTAEVVEVTSVSAGLLTLASGPASSWPAGTRLFPAVQARLTDMPNMNRIGSRILENSIRFETIGDNESTEAAPITVYDGLPVLTIRPDEGESMTHGYSRLFDEIDGETGLKRRYDTADIGFTVQQHQWLSIGRQDRAELRALFYHLDGRRELLWLPTFADDFDLVEPLSAGSNSIEVRRCGFTAYGGPRLNHRDVMIALRDGTTIFRRITGSTLTLDGTELVVLDSALGVNADVRSVRQICFLVQSRLDSDVLELTHHSDLEGAARTSLAFRSAPDTREGSDWFPVLPPDMTMNDNPCGVAECVPEIYVTATRQIADAVSGNQRTNVTISNDARGKVNTYTAFVKSEDGTMYFSQEPGYIFEAPIAAAPSALAYIKFGRIPGRRGYFTVTPSEEYGGLYGAGGDLLQFYDTPAVGVDKGDLFDTKDASLYPIVGLDSGAADSVYLTTYDGSTVRFGAWATGDSPLAGVTALSGSFDEISTGAISAFAAGFIVTRDSSTKRLTFTGVNFFFGTVVESGLLTDGSGSRESFLNYGPAGASGAPVAAAVWRMYSSPTGPGGAVKMRLYPDNEFVTLYNMTALGVAGYTHLANREPIAAAVLPNCNVAIVERRYETVGARLRAYEVLVVHAPLEGKQSNALRLTPSGVGPTGDVQRSADVKFCTASDVVALLQVSFESPTDNTGTTEVINHDIEYVSCTTMSTPE